MNAADLRACRYVVGEELRRRRRTGIPIPEWLRALDTHLAAEMQAASVDGTEPQATQADSELVTSSEAALVTGVSARRIRQIRTDLDGRRIGRQWLFRRDRVEEYARARAER